MGVSLYFSTSIAGKMKLLKSKQDGICIKDCLQPIQYSSSLSSLLLDPDFAEGTKQKTSPQGPCHQR